MSMQARTLRILESANFTPPQAVALAEAIDEEIDGRMDHPIRRIIAEELRARQVVTLPELDRRLAEIKLLISETNSRLFGKIVTLGVAAAGIVVTATFFIVEHLNR